MRKLLALTAVALLCTNGTAQAQMAKSQAKASNGTLIDVNVDEFAGRREFSAPIVNFSGSDGGNGGLLVAKIFKGGKLTALNMQGFIVYSGSWKNYSSAVFRGGDPIKFVPAGKNVGDCHGGCTLTEDFFLEVTAEELSKHAENGVVAVQIRAGPGSTARIDIPLAYVSAVNEVAK